MSTEGALLDFIAFAARRVGPELLDAACEHFGCEANIPEGLLAAIRASLRADLAGDMADVDKRIDEKLRGR